MAGAGIIHQQSHQRVIQGIEYPQNGKSHAGGHKDAQRQAENIGKVVDEGIGFKGVKHIPPNSAKAEENHISSIQFVHLV